MLKKIAVAVLSLFLVLLVIFYNSYSIVLLQNGFRAKDVLQQVALKNENGIAYFVLAANGKGFGIISMRTDALGIWRSVGRSSIVYGKSHAAYVATAENVHRVLPLSGANTYVDSFLAGIIDSNQTASVYTLKQQPGCLFSADLYPVSDNKYLVLFHFTSTADQDKTLTAAQNRVLQTVAFAR